jgi:LytS/YehU family sensor histidine kinase
VGHIHARNTLGVDGTCIVNPSRTSARFVIETNDAPQYVITVPPLKGGRRLLSDDIELLEAVGVMVARRIDGIRLLEERHDHERRQQVISTVATKAELRALRAQINPHFLFNALTTIGYLIQTAPTRALNTLMQLTILLRGVLRSEGALTTLEQELDLVQSYLEIERARFEDRLHVRIEIPRALRKVPVPPLILQPLVENAVKHGVAPQRSGTEVSIHASVTRTDEDQHELILTVHDTGVGVPEALLKQRRTRGLGLSNIEQRLARQYGRQASLTVTSTPGTRTTAEIRLPVAVWAEETVVPVGR